MRSGHWSDVYVAGLAGAISALLAGAWIAAAPFVFTYQPEGADWVDATTVGVGTGIGLAVAGLLAAMLFAAGLRGELTAIAESMESAQSETGRDDLDRAMAEVTAALLTELRGGDRQPSHGAEPTDSLESLERGSR